MALIGEKIGDLIIEALRDTHDLIMLKVLRLMKTEFTLKATAKNAKPLTEEDEFTIIKKMIKQREESIRQYEEAGRPELAKDEAKEITHLKTFLPTAPSIDEIRVKLVEIIDNEYPLGLTKNKMGLVIKDLKTAFPAGDGKEISELVKAYLV